MITLFGQSFAWNEPEVLIPGAVLLLVLGMLLLVLRASGRAAPQLMQEMSWLSQRVQGLSEGQ